MSKAIEGAIEIAGAVGMGAVAFFTAGAALAVPFYAQGMYALGMAGISAEVGALGQALSQNRGTNIVTKNSSANRGIVYGTQRVGGVYMYESTTGSHKSYLNYVVTLSGHLLSGIIGLYLDGRRIYFNTGVGTTTRNGVTFGGTADGNDHIGPDGLKYNFGGEVYAEACYGDQTNQPNTTPGGGFNTGLYANDPTWGNSPEGIPYLGGCAYLYIKIVYDTNLFPAGKPEIRVDVMGKPVYDPRTGTTGYSSNPALIVADILTDSKYGIGGLVVNQAQLIAAANVCDEQVTLASGLTESRYSFHWHYDTGTAPGDAINQALLAMGGRLSFIGGEYYIFPAVYAGPSASFDANALIAPIEWNSHRPAKDLFNRVNGTYSPPAYPYQVSGNAYDKNGYAFDGTGTPNTFALAYQPTSYPQYACDTLHGYAADQYLDEDGGRALPKQLDLAGVFSIAQAQRLAKICLLRNRMQQGSGTFEMGVSAFRLQPGDTFYMTFPAYGWENKLLEVVGWKFNCTPDEHGVPRISCTVDVQETSSLIYDWNVGEELTIYDNPARPNGFALTPAAPTGLTLVSSAATALYAPDGTVTPRISASWNVPEDGIATTVQVQYLPVGASAWIDAVTVDVANTATFISPMVSGQQYEIRIRSVRPSGAVSPWETTDPITAGLVFSQVSQSGIGIGSLIPEAFPDGTAGIVVEPFSAFLGGRSVSYFPSTATITGLVQQTAYWVFVIDPTLQGGDLTPIATTNQADYLGKNGYWLIDTTVTLYAAKTGSGPGGTSPTSSQRYYPTMAADGGTRGTANATSAYDGDLSTFALVSGATTSVNSSAGYCTFSGWPSIALGAASTLTVVATVIASGDDNDCSCDGTVGAGTTSLFDLQSTTAQATYTLAILAGTNLSTVSVSVSANPGMDQTGTNTNLQAPDPDPGPGSGGTRYTPASIRAQVFEIYITT